MVENLGAVDVTFTEEEMRDITRKLDSIEIKGDRKDSDIAKINKLVTVLDTK